MEFQGKVSNLNDQIRETIEGVGIFHQLVDIPIGLQSLEKKSVGAAVDGLNLVVNGPGLAFPRETLVRSGFTSP